MERSARRSLLQGRRLPRELLIAAAVVVLTPALAAGAYVGWHSFSDAQAAAQASAAIAAARHEIDLDQQLGVDSEDLTPIQQSLTAVERQDGQARGAAAHRAAANSAAAVQSKAAALGRQQQKENQAIGSEADGLAGSTDSTDALRQSGQAALAKDRNDATVAVFVGARGIDHLARNAERYAAYLSASDRKQVALGVAGVRYMGGEIHQAMISALPRKAITISINAQELVAYENGKPVLQTAVTTGHIPDLATDVGPMKVLKKDSPWKMHSPWPKGSPNWYPDTVVQMVVWFTATGEGMHDASWQTLPYGPGSETGPDASHGCVHVPFDAEKFLFSWSDLGQPVIVFPGDGSPLQSQLDQRSVDQNGYPLSGPRGA